MNTHTHQTRMPHFLRVRLSETAPFPICVSKGPVEYIMYCMLPVTHITHTFQSYLIHFHGREDFFRESYFAIWCLDWLYTHTLPAKRHLTGQERENLTFSIIIIGKVR